MVRLADVHLGEHRMVNYICRLCYRLLQLMVRPLGPRTLGGGGG